jgi:hypothetical protein
MCITTLFPPRKFEIGDRVTREIKDCGQTLKFLGIVHGYQYQSEYLVSSPGSELTINKIGWVYAVSINYYPEIEDGQQYLDYFLESDLYLVRGDFFHLVSNSKNVHYFN